MEALNFSLSFLIWGKIYPLLQLSRAIDSGARIIVLVLAYFQPYFLPSQSLLVRDNILYLQLGIHLVSRASIRRFVHGIFSDRARQSRYTWAHLYRPTNCTTENQYKSAYLAICTTRCQDSDLYFGFIKFFFSCTLTEFYYIVYNINFILSGKIILTKKSA